ncbi:MAG: phosphodiester glycosidase family protein [Clostridium sp.]|nr:phosphodiester glycosidase family protein [Clostridium sp.]
MKKFLTIMVLLTAAMLFCSKADADLICNDCSNIEISNSNGLYIIHIPAARKSRIEPHITKFLTTNREVFKKTGAELVINAGYFDPKNHGTSSYVVINKETVLDPEENSALMENQALVPHMKKILNRSEFRILNCRGHIRYEIAPHNAKIPFRCELVHSIQAGPLLYPDLRLEEEYFVSKENDKVVRDSISALKKCARTAIGYKDDDLYIIIATTKHKLTLPELSEVCRQLSLDKAMNFDGGGSTSLNFKGTKNPDYKNWEITSDKDKNARKLKSFLVIY